MKSGQGKQGGQKSKSPQSILGTGDFSQILARLCTVHWVQTAGYKMQKARLQGVECKVQSAEGRMQDALGSWQCTSALSAVCSKSPSLPQVYNYVA